MKTIFAFAWGLLGLCFSAPSQVKGDAVQKALEIEWMRVSSAAIQGNPPQFSRSAYGEDGPGSNARYSQEHSPNASPASSRLAPFSIRPQNIPGRVTVAVEDRHIRITHLRMATLEGKTLWEETWPSPDLTPLEFDLFLYRYPAGVYRFEIGTESGTWSYEWTRP